MNITIGQPECPEPIEIKRRVPLYNVPVLSSAFSDKRTALHAVALYLLECPSSTVTMLLSGELKDVAVKLGVSVKTVRGYQYRDTTMPRTTRLLCLHLIGFKLENDIWCLTSE